MLYYQLRETNLPTVDHSWWILGQYNGYSLQIPPQVGPNPQSPRRCEEHALYAHVNKLQGHGIRALSDVTCAYRNLSPSFVSKLMSVQNSSHLLHARQHPARPIITHDVSTSSATVCRPNTITEELCGMVHSQILCQCRYLATVPFCGTSRPPIMTMFCN